MKAMKMAGRKGELVIRRRIAALGLFGVLLLLAGSSVVAHADPADPRQDPFDPTLWDWATNGDGRSEAFYTGNDWPFEVVHIWQLYRGGPMSGPESLGGDVLGSPSATKNCTDRLHVFVVGTNHHVYVRWQSSPGSGPWEPADYLWYDFGGYATSNPAAFINFNGEMEVFVRGGDNAIWTRRQMGPCGPWTPWTSLGGVLTDYPRLPSVGYEWTTVQATGADGFFWCTTRWTTNGGWYPWEPC